MSSVYTLCSDRNLNDVITDVCVNDIDNIHQCIPKSTVLNGVTTNTKTVESVLIDNRCQLEVIHRSKKEAWLTIYFIREFEIIGE